MKRTALFLSFLIIFLPSFSHAAGDVARKYGTTVRDDSGNPAGDTPLTAAYFERLEDRVDRYIIVEALASSPPVTCGTSYDGHTYIISGTPSGAWSAFSANDFVRCSYQDSTAAWKNETPKEGFFARDSSTDRIYYHTGSAWTDDIKQGDIYADKLYVWTGAAYTELTFSTVDNATIENNAGTLRVKDDGITAAKLSDTGDFTMNSLSTGSIIFEGATADNYETTVNVADPTADRTVTFGNLDLSFDQSVASGATPTFTGTNFTGIPTGGLLDDAVTPAKITASLINTAGQFSDTFVPWSVDPVIEYSGTEALNGFGSVWKEGATYHAWYQYNLNGVPSIGHATSSDGKTWTKDAANNPVFSGSGGANWDASAVGVPQVWKEGSDYHMIYRGRHNTEFEFRVGHATSTDGITWTRAAVNNCSGTYGAVGNGCVFEMDEATYPWEDGDGAGVGEGLEICAVIKVGSTYYGYYNIFGDTRSGASTDRNRQIGIATSTDLNSWTRNVNNPIFTSGRYSPGVIKHGSFYYLFLPHYRTEPPTPWQGEIELYRDTLPTFLSATRQNLGVVIPAVQGGTLDDFDVPFILTDTIERNTFRASSGELWMYVSAADGNSWNFNTYLFMSAVQSRKWTGDINGNSRNLYGLRKLGINDTDYNNQSILTVISPAAYSAYGTVTVSGTSVTCDGYTTTTPGCDFLYDTTVGDRVTINAETRVVTAITDEWHLTVNSAFTGTPAAQIMTVYPGLMRAETSANAVKFFVSDQGNIEFTPTQSSDGSGPLCYESGTVTGTSRVTKCADDNSATATALAANGTNCSAGSYPLGVDASGNVESCTSAVTGTGDFSSNTTTSVDSEIVLFSGTSGKTGKRATGTGIAKITSGVLGTASAGDFPTLNQSTSGNAATASALAANGANCAAGEYPLGVDASGAAESCTDATTEIGSAISSHAGVTNAHGNGINSTGVANALAFYTEADTTLYPADGAGTDGMFWDDTNKKLGIGKVPTLNTSIDIDRIYTAAVNGIYYTSVYVGHPTHTGNSSATYYGLYSRVEIEDTYTNSSLYNSALTGYARLDVAGTVGHFTAVSGFLKAEAGTISKAYNFKTFNIAGAGTITEQYGFYAEPHSTSGTVGAYRPFWYDDGSGAALYKVEEDGALSASAEGVSKTSSATLTVLEMQGIVDNYGETNDAHLVLTLPDLDAETRRIITKFNVPVTMATYDYCVKAWTDNLIVLDGVAALTDNSCICNATPTKYDELACESWPISSGVVDIVCKTVTGTWAIVEDAVGSCPN